MAGLNIPPIAPSVERRGPGVLRSWWAKTAGGIAFVLLAAGLLTPYFLNGNGFREVIATSISQQTGRKVTLGAMRVTILPRVGFSVQMFHMGNPAGFAPGSFLYADQVRGGLAFWPLILHREYQITSLELVQPKLVLLEDQNGHNNYTFTPEPTGTTPSAAGVAAFAAADSGSEMPPLESAASILDIEQLTLRNAEVVFGRVDLSGRAVPLVDAAGFSAVLQHLTLQPLRITDWQAAASLDGTRITLAGWNTPVSFRAGSAHLQNGSLQCNFSVSLGSAAQADGTVSVANVEHAMANFDLKTADLNLATLIAAQNTAAASEDIGREDFPRATSSNAFSRATTLNVSQTMAPVPSRATDAAGVLLAQGHVAADRIHLAPYVAGPATADLRLYTDRLEIWPITLRLYGGSLQLSARTDRKQTPQRFSTNMEARNLNLGQLLETSPAARDKFAGTGEFDLQLFGSLEPGWVKSLTGSGQFAVRNGRIRGISLTGPAESFAKMAGIGSDLPFTAITGIVGIRGQRISSPDVRLNSPHGTADMLGSLGFNGSLEFDGLVNARVDMPPSAGQSGTTSSKLTIPLSLRGTLQQPDLEPGHTMPTFPAASQAAPGRTRTAGCCSFPNLFEK